MLTDGVAFFSNTASGIESVITFGVAAGIAVVASFIIMGIFVPLVMMRQDERRKRVSVPQPTPSAVSGATDTNTVSSHGRSRLDELSVGSLVVKLTQHRVLVLPVVAVITAAAVFFAFKLEAQLDVKEFFDSKSDFVVSLDKIDEHVGTTQGEPAIIYVEGDLSSLDSLSALRNLGDALKNKGIVPKQPPVREWWHGTEDWVPSMSTRQELEHSAR